MRERPPSFRRLRREARALDALSRRLAVRLWDQTLRFQRALFCLDRLRTCVANAYARPEFSVAVRMIAASNVLDEEAEFVAACAQHSETHRLATRRADRRPPLSEVLRAGASCRAGARDAGPSGVQSVNRDAGRVRGIHPKSPN